jgi:hypothetical protein
LWQTETVKRKLTITDQLRARGVLAPAFCALGIATEVTNLQMDSPLLFWMGLGYAAMGLAFSRYTSQLLAHALSSE